MPTQGGPSRRSHTKSRKGCKTCKRRHIRCDETFPQCRNCSKHHVRCDYMDTQGLDPDVTGHSPEQKPSVVLTPNSERGVELWQQTGSFPYPELNVFPQPSVNEHSHDELRLMHHLSRLSSELQFKGLSEMTIWTQRMPKFLSVACSYPYVMHALLAFSANHLSWMRDSNDARNMHIHHGAIALGGLHEAIGNFSPANADAVLAASLLLLWQATDWRSWSSLRSGIQSVLTAMQNWNHDSVFAEFVVEEDLVATAYRTHRRTASVSPAERNNVLQNVILALRTLQGSLAGQELEAHWVGQVMTYMQTLATLDAPRSAEDQFNLLYHLRKWLFWAPVQLLHRHEATPATIMTLAHLYAVALAVEPLFPDLGSSFCAAMALPPLEATLSWAGTGAIDMSSSLQWPQQMALSFRTRAMMVQPVVHQEPTFTLSLDTLGYTNVGNISPAFAPAGLHPATPQTATSSSSRSSFLEVPTFSSGFSYGTESCGAVPSPGLPATEYGGSSVVDEIEIYGYSPISPHGHGYGHGGINSDGFVSPSLVWA